MSKKAMMRFALCLLALMQILMLMVNCHLLNRRDNVIDFMASSVSGEYLNCELVKNGKTREAENLLRERFKRDVNYIVSEKLKRRSCFALVYAIRSSKDLHEWSFDEEEIRAMDQYIKEVDERNCWQVIKNRF